MMMTMMMIVAIKVVTIPMIILLVPSLEVSMIMMLSMEEYSIVINGDISAII